MLELQIGLTTEWTEDAETLRSQLREVLSPEERREIRLQIPFSAGGSRAPTADSAVVVAAIAATSAVISALVSALFRFLESKGSRNVPIIITGAGGITVQVPPGTKPEAIGPYVDLIKTLEAPRIHLVLSSSPTLKDRQIPKRFGVSASE